MRLLALAALAWVALEGRSLAGSFLEMPPEVEPAPLSLYGLTGVIDTPSARMMDDGELAITGDAKKPDDRVAISFQALPWLELTARYTKVSDFFGPHSPLYDRSLGFKLKLMNEGQYRPAFAVGALDVGGTMIYGGEYLVTSKRLGPFDASLGLGFGRLGSRGQFENPFSLISKNFDTRPPSTGTGKLGLKNFFHGRDVSLFGGISYDTPIKGLQLLAEYSGDDYVQEQALGLVKIKSPINVGVSYRPFRWLELGGYWTYNTSFAFRISLRENLSTGDQGQKLDPPPVPTHVRTRQEIDSGRIESALGASSPVGLLPGRKVTAARVGRDQISNAPDFEVTDNPLSDESVVWEAKAETPGSPIANAAEIARIRAELTSLDMTLASVGIDDAQAVLVVVPKTGLAPLPCEVMWHQISVGRLTGIDAITFVNSTGGHEVSRCTKFIEPDEMQAKPIANAASLVTPVADTPQDANDVAAPREALASNDEDISTLTERIRNVFSYQGLSLDAFKLNGKEAIVYMNNLSYHRVGRALGRAARALTALMPPKVDMITIIETDGTFTGAKLQIPRTELERVAVNDGSAEEIFAASTVSPASPRIVPDADYKRSHTFAFSPVLAPAFRPSLFDPDNPFRYQFLIRAGGTLQLMRGLSLQAIYDINIYNDFDQITRVSDSKLPHVRSDFRYYLQKGASGIENLQLTLLHQFSPSWTARLSAGYLEQMYGGVSGEILYAPFRQRWAIGLDVAGVKQRDFDELFGFRDYKTITGHLELYYQTPFQGVELHLLYGRYLAKDWGTTIELARHFANGAEVSAYATFTNVPASKFGEGSFDKGIRITIPLDFYSLFSTKQSTTVELKPLTRDGGAILYDGPKLYPIVRSLSYGEAYQTFDAFLDK